MSMQEAISLLVKCRPLANKLVKEGLNFKVDGEDEIALNYFSRVWAAGLLNNSKICSPAGLSLSEIDYLTVKMVKEVASSI